MKDYAEREAAKRQGEGSLSRPDVIARLRPDRGKGAVRQPTCRSIIIALISAIALAGLRFFGQVFEQFMIVWQR